jgi:alpha-tubulin suppressor-like RCC1 family protein
LVDSLGAPRAGVPIVFSVSANGRVTQPVVSTNADGIASPGTWTLGDIPGEQQLEATVADARVVLRATGTGTPIHYKPSTVVAGANSSCALEAGGAVTCWGESPQNGSGSVTHTSTPTAVSGSLVAATLRGGASHFCAVTAAGRAWCWGLNALTDTTGAVVTTNAPLELMSDATWSSVSPGASHNCGLSAQVAYCWGNNQLGQLGDGTVPPPITRFTIRAVLGGFGFTQLSAGAAHNCGVSSGSAFCWGSNQFGQLGDGSIVTRLAPTAVAGGQNFLSVGAGGGFSCGLNSQGRVYCWGALVSTPGATPFTYPTAPNFTSLTVGGGHACALTTANEAYCWGNNDSGQLGDSTLTARANPTRVAGPLRFQQLSAGLTHTCGITTDGAVACWGQNRGGELGDNTSTFRTAPKHVVIGVQP